MHKLTKSISYMIAILLLTIFALAGCGGSSSGSNSLNMFVTDDANTGYSGVWVKIYKASLRTATGASVEVLNSTEGITINLRALNDGAAKFLLLAPGKVPDGTYTKVDFEVDKTVTLVATPSGTVSTANFPDSLDASVAGHSKLSADLSPVLVIPGANRIVIDFDLSQWTVSGGIITPVLHRHDENGCNDINRHEHFEFTGIVGDLSGTAPTQTFTLSLRSGGTATVTTDDTTAILSEGNTASLSNGLKVEVFGVYDPTTNAILAKIIRAEDQFSQDAKAIGLASDANVGAETFTMDPAFTRHFTPQGETITVSTNSNTHFRGRHGSNLTKAEFYAAIASAGPNAVVEAQGSFDVNTNTLTANTVHIENEADFGEDEAKGIVSLANVVNGTFDLAITESEGFTPPQGALHVAVTNDATYKNGSGQVMTMADFFTAISAGSITVKVKGSFANDVFTATRLEIKN